MGHRTLAFVIGVATALSAQAAVALGLGEIKLNSTLNQPLDAEIKLLQVRDLSEQEILVGLASLEDFRRVGVDRPFFLSDLKFNVELESSSGPVVHITSDKPVREPFLNFVVQAQWPSGRLLREYTLLMDLPTFAEDEKAQPVQPAQQGGSGSRSAAPSPETRAPQQARPQAEREPSGGGTTYGPVKASDTLWDIAAASRPDRSISVQQAMIAIQRANPGAFINNNINMLREGQVLRIPGRSEMTELGARDAISEVAAQNQRWSGAGDTSGGDSSEQGAQLEGSRSYTRAQEESLEPEGRVKLASPEDYSASSEGRSTGSGGGDTDALENELATTLEELDKARSENSELRSRIQAMEEQIETMQRLVDVSSDEMRALQLASQQAQESQTDDASAAEPQELFDPEQTADELAMDDESGEASDAAAETMPEEVGAEATTDQEAQAEEAEAPPVDRSRVVRSAPQQEKSIVDLLMDNILYVGLGLLALLAALAVALRSRRKTEDDFDDFLSEPDTSDFEELSAYRDDNADEEAAFIAAAPEEDIEETPPAEPEEQTEQETEDAVAEAEIYIALAKYDQAEEILQRALEKEPEDTAIRLKLLELYASQQDVDNFDPHFAKLRVLGDAHATARAEELRAKIKDAPAFDESRFDVSDFAAEVGGAAGGAALAAGSADYDDFNLETDLSFDELEAEPADDAARVDEEINASLNAADEDDLGDFSLDLDEALLEEPDSSTESSSDTEGLDFDFELDIEEDSSEEDSDTDALDLSDEFEFDLGLDETDEAEDATLVRPSASEELEAFDYDLGDLETEDSNELELNDELKSDMSAAANGSTAALQEDELSGDSVGLDSVDENSIDLPEGLGLDEPETLEDALDDNSATSSGLRLDDESQEDELNIDADMDLSALDKELDDITADFDPSTATPVDLEEALAEEPAAPSQELSASSEEPSAPQEETLEAMEEPDIDFGDMDDLLEGLDQTEEASDTAAWQSDLEALDAELEKQHPQPMAEEDDLLDIDGQAEATELPVLETAGAAEAEDVAIADDEAEAGTEAMETNFDELLSADSDFDLDDFDAESDDDSDLGFLSDTDETATKLDLARAYMDMGDSDGAKDILDEIVQEGNDEQRKQAQDLLERI